MRRCVEAPDRAAVEVKALLDGGRPALGLACGCAVFAGANGPSTCGRYCARSSTEASAPSLATVAIGSPVASLEAEDLRQLFE